LGANDLTKHASCVATSFVNAMVLNDLAPETSCVLEGFAHIDRLGLPHRELHRDRTECIALHIPHGISAFRDGSIRLAIIREKRGY